MNATVDPGQIYKLLGRSEDCYFLTVEIINRFSGGDTHWRVYNLTDGYYGWERDSNLIDNSCYERVA